MADGCQCIKCIHEQTKDTDDFTVFITNFRYGCEICGNKRCPHHTNHRNACTNSNEPGQAGSIYA